MTKTAVFISAAEIARRINASEYAVRKYIRDNGITPISYAGTKKNRPLYNGDSFKKIKMNCKKRKPKSPRPPSKMITIRVTKNEYANLQKTAEKFNLPISTLIKKVATGKKVTASKPAKKVSVADPKLLTELNRIGNNINQIAHTLNIAKSSGTINSTTIIQATAILIDIEDQLQDVIQ